ncbi:MAG: hypothetical protein V3U37_04945 [Nitrospinaceae bacterium]
MAVKCSGCGNFISPEIKSCPICGDKNDFEASPYEVGSHPAHGLIYDMWGSFWQSKNEGLAMSRKEALLLKILVGVLVLLLAATLISNP